jgi:hypothetical protein
MNMNVLKLAAALSLLLAQISARVLVFKADKCNTNFEDAANWSVSSICKSLGNDFRLSYA